MKKIYYICKSRSGCFGCSGTVERLEQTFTNKIKAEKELISLRRNNDDKRIIYWIDFVWK